MKLTGVKAPLDTILLARIFDDFQVLLYSFSEDSKTGVNRPESFADKLLGIASKKDEVKGYASGDEFMRAREEILRQSRLKKG